MKAIAAERGFLVSKVDAQAQGTSGDDLMLYRAFCEGLTVPSDYLDGDGEAGLLSVLEEVAERLQPTDVTAALKQAVLPMQAVRDPLVAVVRQPRLQVIDGGETALDEGWRALASVLCGERPSWARSLGALRARHPGPFGLLKRFPGRRDARLWLESMLIALRHLGFPGTLVVLDEHDQASPKILDGSIVQLRHQLDRIAEGHLPGVFVLQLVLEDFPARVREHHSALEQRVMPILGTTLRSRLLMPLADLRDVDGPAFLEQVGDRLHHLIAGGPISDALRRRTRDLARKHSKLQGPDTRAFVKAFSQALQAA